MHSNRKSASVPKDTPLPISSLWRWTSMAVDTFRVVTFGPVRTRCHPCHQSQNFQLLFCRLIFVDMGALIAKWTLVTQEVHIAHLEPFHAQHLILVIWSLGIHTLAFAIARNFWSNRSGNGCG